MLAALAPSAVLAAPPDRTGDEVKGITWRSYGTYTNGLCGSYVQVTYTVAKGSPRYLYTSLRMGTQDLGYGTVKVERDGAMDAGMPSIGASQAALYCPGLAVCPLTASAVLKDAKGTVLSAWAQTSPAYAWDPTGCPAQGAELGTYPAP
jgi:hypothetical protein